MFSKIVTPLLFATITTTALGDVWEQKTSMPGPGRHHPVTFTLGGYGYVATGTTSGASASDDFYRYDPVANTWETLPDFPGTDRGYSYGGTYGGKGYLGFGRGTGYLDDLWEYDPGTEQWTQLASCPGQPRSHPAFIITDDGKIYVGCGSSSIGNLGDWWEYDIGDDTWVQHLDLPGPNRHHPYYFNVGNVPFVGFGHGAGIFKDFYRFNPDTDTWTQMADFPGEGRVAGTQFTNGSKGYILSGEGEDHNQLDEGEFWEYDADTDTWTQLVSHPGTGRWAPGTFVIGDTVYLTAGLSTTVLERDLWKADMGTVVGIQDASTTSPAVALRAPRPNPFSVGTAIGFELLSAGHVTLGVFDAVGREVRSLASSTWPTGHHTVTWDGRSDRGEPMSPGVYFVRLATPEATTSRRVVLLR